MANAKIRQVASAWCFAAGVGACIRAEATGDTPMYVILLALAACLFYLAISLLRPAAEEAR